MRSRGTGALRRARELRSLRAARPRPRIRRFDEVAGSDRNEL